MKSTIYYIAVLVFSLTGCQASRYITGEHQYISKPSKEVIRVKSTGYSNKRYVKFLGIVFAPRKASAQRNAELGIFENLLFSGIVGSEIRYPLIHPSEQIRARNSVLVKEILEHRYYRKYIRRKDERVLFKFDTESKRTSAETLIDINIHSLRQDLEDHGIIQKYGL